MGSYLGKHADYYDVFYQDKPYPKEAVFVHECLERFSEGRCDRLLELACGTGSHAFELEKLGHEIVALDYSTDLLEIAKRKAEKKNSNISFVLQDMRNFSFSEKKFDAAYCLFDSIGYVQTNAAIGQVLDNVWDNLRAKGLFVFEFWHAAAMIKHFEVKRERHWKTKSGEITRISTTRLDIPRQLAEVTYQIDANENGRIIHLEETQVNRYFLVQEMASFLENHRFEPVEFLPAYEKSTGITDKTWHILAIARKRSV